MYFTRLTCLILLICVCAHGQVRHIGPDSFKEKGFLKRTDPPNYGVPSSDSVPYPTYQERAILTLTNAARMGPIGFRNFYLGNLNIMQTATYPAVNPLFWQYDLNRSSRNHSVDMFLNGYFAHDTQSVTPAQPWYQRIGSFYTKSSTIGENIAVEQSSGNKWASYDNFTLPIVAMRQWLCECVDNSGDCGCTVPPDGTAENATFPSGDGHRANVMSNMFHEIGVGFWSGYTQHPLSASFHYEFEWTQDFGAGIPMYSSKIVSGSHLFIAGTGGSQNITFMANYYDPTGATPQSAAVVISGATYPLSLWTNFGSASRGSYAINVAKVASGCRSYYFRFVDGNGAIVIYPSLGYFNTIGENSACTVDYSAGSTTSATSVTTAATTTTTAATTTTTAATTATTAATTATTAATTSVTTGGMTIGSSTTSSSTTGSVVGPVTIFGDAITLGWDDFSSPTLLTTTTTPVYSGTKSIAFSCSNNAKLYFHKQAFIDTSVYKKLTFLVNGGLTGGQSFKLNLVKYNSATGVSTATSPTLTFSSIPANVWAQATVAFATYWPTGVYDGFWFQDNTGRAQNTLFIDQIVLAVN